MVSALPQLPSLWDMAKSGMDLATYRLSIGVWIAATGGGRFSRRARRPLTSPRRFTLFFVALYLFLLLRADALPSHGDVERNPGLNSVVAAAAGSCSDGLITNSKSTALPWRPSESAQAPTLLSFLVTNARRLLPKIEELSSVVMKVKPSLVFVTETWLNDSVPSSLLNRSPGSGRPSRWRSTSFYS